MNMNNRFAVVEGCPGNNRASLLRHWSSDQKRPKQHKPTCKESLDNIINLTIVSMDIIPRDLWPTIVAYMDDQTKRKMRLASTTWFNLIKYDNFKLYGTRSDDIPAITERLLKYNWKINLAFKRPQIIDSTIFVEHLPKLTNLRELLAYECPSPNNTKDQWMRFSTLTNMEDWQFGYDVPLRLLQNFVNLRTWKRYGSEETLAPILKQMGNLSSLTFIDDSAQTWPFALVKYAEKLTSLDIFMQGRFTKGNEMALFNESETFFARRGTRR